MYVFHLLTIRDANVRILSRATVRAHCRTWHEAHVRAVAAVPAPPITDSFNPLVIFIDSRIALRIIARPVRSYIYALTNRLVSICIFKSPVLILWNLISRETSKANVNYHKSIITRIGDTCMSLNSDLKE